MLSSITVIDGEKAGSVAGDKPKSAVKRRASTPGSTAKKRKVADLETSIEELKKKVENLKKSKAKLEKTLRQGDAPKFPVKDDLITSYPGQAPPTPLPLGKYNLRLDESLFTSAVAVWDFLTCFRNQVSLPVITMDDFFDLLLYTQGPSVAMNEIVSSLLRIVLADKVSATRLTRVIPRHVNFSYRPSAAEVSAINFSAAAVAKAAGTAAAERGGPSPSPLAMVSRLSSKSLNSLAEMNAECTCTLGHKEMVNHDIFDVSYNGLALLPRKLTVSLVNYYSLNAVVRSILLRLQPILSLRQALASLPTHRSCSSVCVGLNTTQSATVSFGGKLEWNLLNQVETARSHRKGKIDRDVLFGVSCDPLQLITQLSAACIALEHQELHELPAGQKLVVFNALVSACLETKEMRNLLERNLEERANRHATMEKVLRENKVNQKNFSAEMKAAALEACRKANMEAALKGKKKPTKSSSSKSKTAKDEFDPTPAQLTAMLEDMVVLENVGVDEVFESVSLEPPEGYGEKDCEEDEGEDDLDDVAKQLFSRKATKKVTNKKLERRRAIREYEDSLERVNAATEQLTQALESNLEKNIRSAVRFGARNGLRWRNDENVVCCTELMKQGYKALAALEAKAKEQQAEAEYENALIEFAIRTVPLGLDRHGNTYWYFNHCPNKLFVQLNEEAALTSASFGVQEDEWRGVICRKLEHYRQVKSRSLMVQAPAAELMSIGQYLGGKSGSISSNVSQFFGTVVEDPTLAVLYRNRPIRGKGEKWFVYDDQMAIWNLYEALDSRGERESALKQQLRGRFQLEEPPRVYLTEGSEFLGRQVRRRFGRGRIVIGTIVGWLPKEGEDEALWHVRHLDGDEEDLDEKEVEDCLVALQEKSDESDEGEDPDKAGSADADSDKIGMELQSEEDENIDRAIEMNGPSEHAPSIIENFSCGNRAQQFLKNSHVGIEGLRQECAQLIPSLLESIGPAFTGDGTLKQLKKSVEQSILDTDTLEELKDALYEAEKLFRNLQSVPDISEQEEREAVQRNNRREMEKDGWVFAAPAPSQLTNSSSTTPNGVIDFSQPWTLLGTNVTRSFPDFGMSDGVIIGYLPADKNEGEVLWHMLHVDGDSEDLDERDVRRAWRLYRKVHSESTAEDSDGESSHGEDSDNEQARNGEEGDESDAESSEEGSDDDDRDADDQLGPNGDYYTISAVAKEKRQQNRQSGDASSALRPTLWTTATVRERWQSCLQNSKTIGEVYFALFALHRFASSFVASLCHNHEKRKKTAKKSAASQAKAAEEELVDTDEEKDDVTYSTTGRPLRRAVVSGSGGGSSSSRSTVQMAFSDSDEEEESSRHASRRVAGTSGRTLRRRSLKGGSNNERRDGRTRRAVTRGVSYVDYL